MGMIQRIMAVSDDALGSCRKHSIDIIYNEKTEKYILLCTLL